MADCKSGHTFRNWAQTLEFKPHQFCRPKTVAALQEIVKQAKDRGGCVRVQGAGHSFSQLLATNDTLVTLDDMDHNTRIIQGNEVTVSAGIRLKDLIPRLASDKLALRNLGSITEQSVAGAASTGTHGTGVTKGAIPTQIVAAMMVAGDGSVVTLDKGDARLKAAALSLGALGILTQVTLDCVPHYQVEYNVYIGKFEAALDSLDQLLQENERMLLWWLAPLIDRDDVLIITKNGTGNAQGPGLLGSAEERVASGSGLARRPLAMQKDDLFEAVAAQGRGANKFRKIWSMKGDYDRMLTIPLLPIFHTESEYAVPVENAAKALRAFRDVVEENDFEVKLPVEVRFTAKDDLYMSPCNKGPVCYIGASTEANKAELFSRFEPIMRLHGGRPHWGKHFTLLRSEIEAMYGQNHVDFVKVRQQLDPQKVFANSLLRDIFG